MYAVGGFNFPTSTGNFSVTGLGFQPQAVIMFGSNRPEVGSLVTGLTGPGLFVSINALDYANLTTIRSICIAINGRSAAGRANERAYENGPISMCTDATTATVVDYKADSITFGADGFTIHVSTAASGTRPIHYVAWGGPEMQTGAVKQIMSGSPTFANSYNPLSTIVLGTIAASGFGEGSVTGSSWFSWGSGHYPAYQSGNVNTWHSSTVYCQVQMSSPLGRQGFNEHHIWSGTGGVNNVNVSNVITTVGPALVEGYRRHRPDVGGVGLETMINNGGGTPWQYAVWSDGEGWTNDVSVATGGTTTVQHPTNFDEFAAVIFSTINGPQNTGGPGAAYQAFGFGVLGPDYQGCVVFGPDGSFYQAVDRCAARCTASAVNTVSGVINPTSFTLTQEEGSAVNELVWHGFGSPVPTTNWIPQIYRRVFR